MDIYLLLHIFYIYISRLGGIHKLGKGEERAFAVRGDEEFVGGGGGAMGRGNRGIK